MGLSKHEAVNYALRLVLETETEVSGVTAKDILAAAENLAPIFTMEQLLDSIFRDEPIFAPHGTKIRIARVLSASGYHRKQVRQKGKRPLVWSKENNNV